MLSSGWIRVASGFRLVASAVVQQASAEAGSAATRTAQHGVDLAANLRSVAAMHQHQPPMSGFAPPSTGTTTRTDNRNYEPPKEQPQSPIQHSSRTSVPPSQSPPEPPPLNGLLHAPKDEATRMSPTARTNNIESSTTISSQSTITSASVNDEIQENFSHKQPKFPTDEVDEHTDYPRLQEGRAVPSTRTGRAFGFASLGLGLAAGAVGEGIKRLTGQSTSTSGSNVLINDGNSDRLAQSLCRMRGAALKMGQMLSIQDESLLPPELTRALKQVRQGADAMPEYQLTKQLQAQLGPDWRNKFESFDMKPFAAASVGQCHRAVIKLADSSIQNVVVKVQYPGVGSSIESDLRNLSMLVKWTGLAPKGLFLDNVIRIGQQELQVECDYNQERQHQQRMQDLVSSDPFLVENNFVVPKVFDDWTTDQIITTAFARGGTIDKVSDMDQDERNRIGRVIMYLTIQELFVWRFMQTDPNWGNFLYDVGTKTTNLIDFGATREYSKEFVDGYLRIVWASANQDEERLMEQSYKMNFLTGEENDTMLRAHKLSGYTVGEPFATNDAFDFKGSKLSTRMGEHTSVFLKHRLT